MTLAIGLMGVALRLQLAALNVVFTPITALARAGPPWVARSRALPDEAAGAGNKRSGPLRTSRLPDQSHACKHERANGKNQSQHDGRAILCGNAKAEQTNRREWSSRSKWQQFQRWH